MGILKKKKKEEPKEEKIEKKVEKKPEVSVKKEVKKERIGKAKTAFKILKEPHITEKATDLAGKNQYVFKVFPKANKTEIKKAVKDLYGVDVLSVNIIKIPPKQRKFGKTRGVKKGFKKAIVKIKKGQVIEVMPR